MKEQTNALNKILSVIDEKASRYKEERFDMREAQSVSEKKLLFDLIDDALSLANQMNPKPVEAISDLNRLSHQLSGMH